MGSQLKKYLGQAAAILIMILLTIWMYSGIDGDLMPSGERDTTQSNAIPRVQTQVIASESVQRVLEVSAETKANRSVDIRAQWSGEVKELLHRRGDRVQARDVIARLDRGELPERLLSAQALEQQRKVELDGVRTLVSRGLQNTTNLAAAETAYADAIANRRSLELQLQHTNIRAPFAGVIETLNIELGSYVQAGGSVAHLNDFSPLMITAQVSENDVINLRPGQSADVWLVSGETLEGEVSFVGTQARAATRTFDVEVASKTAVPSPSAGVTARVHFALPARNAHFISPALLTLDQAGNLSLKIVTPEQRVALVNVDIVKSSTQGVWVSGLPNPAQIITVGQGFVSHGDLVEAVVTE
ncbi:efflux RND transporter periplasmic adaptor subunit [Salinispirillum sp. LH 10-3-1]|uniref:Efflux RND transporter periplasmic adaptor subunit n=1 Tax=Salinispirillum sp. LH 10-3-1 TaxID=2952525 RepID=A0AB38YKA7_9GAMM